LTNTLIVILARANSKRLPGKHLLYVNSKKLIERVILSCLTVDDAVVATSSDDPGVLKVAEAYDLPNIDRPEWMYDETAPDYAARWMPAMFTLLATWWKWRTGSTDPFKWITVNGNTLIMCDAMIQEVVDGLDEPGIKLVDTVCPVGNIHPYDMVTVDDRNEMSPFLTGLATRPDSKEFPPVWFLNGGPSGRWVPRLDDGREVAIKGGEHDAIHVHTQEDYEVACALWGAWKTGRHNP